MKKRQIFSSFVVSFFIISLSNILSPLAIKNHKSLTKFPVDKYNKVSSLSINLILFEPEYTECGHVKINGYVGTSEGSITHLTWDWGDGTIINSWFPASHEYSNNGIYSVQVTAYTSTGDTKTVATTVTAINAEDPFCSYTVRLYPTTVVLRDSHITETLHLSICDADGGLISPNGRQVSFTSSNPSLVQVDTSGVVTSTGFGEAEIEVIVQGIPRKGKAKVVAGKFSLTPAILHLSVNNNPTGQLTIHIENPDGTQVSLAGKSIEYWGSNPVANVSSSGLVTALRPPQIFNETPYIRVSVDGIFANNSSVIRVTDNSLGLTMATLRENNIIFEIAEQVGTWNYLQIFNAYEIVRVSNIAYLLQTEACGTFPFNGGIQFLVNDLNLGSSGTGPCGLSGNPVRLGTDVEKTVHNSCLIIAANNPAEASPQWFVIFHEIGHNFTYASRRLSQFMLSHSDNAYLEGLGSLAAMYAMKKMVVNASSYGLSDDIASTLEDQAGWRYLESLEQYVNSGAIYQTIDPNIVDGILFQLEKDYGLSIWYRFFSVFLPPQETLEVDLKTDTEVATYFAAACSAAARTDLKIRFRDDWGYPIDAGFYDQIFPAAQIASAQRDPRAFIQSDEEADVGNTVTLNGSGSFDPQGMSLTYYWSFTERPEGSFATLSDPTSAAPAFMPDRAGNYSLTLKVDNGLTTSLLETHTIQASGESIVPEIALSLNSLNFGASSSGAYSPPQYFRVSNSGGGILGWTVTDNTAWLDCTSIASTRDEFIHYSGMGNAVIKVSVDPNGLSDGTYSGTIQVSGNASNSPQSVNVTFIVKDPSDCTIPFGSFDTPLEGTIGVTGAIPITGWVLDDIGVELVKVYRDPVAGEDTEDLIYIGDAMFVEGARADVEQAYPDYPLNYQAGWGYMMLTNFLPGQGNGTYRIHAYATDIDGHTISLGTKTITCDNANAVKPFGAIDTPTQGGTVTGPFFNAGWALTPMPNLIPTDGSTINVWVDGQALGHPAYNQYRDDIAKLFPGYANTDGAVGAYYLDTTTYTNGVHTIAWSVSDNAENSDGIGSRFFTIANTGGSAQAEIQSHKELFGPSVSYESILNMPINFDPIKYNRGYRKNIEPRITKPDEYGKTTIEIREVDRLEIELGKGVSIGYVVVGDQLRSLPIGSTLDIEKGLFYWQPGPGFIGEYDLEFIKVDEFGMQGKIQVKVKIRPKFGIYNMDFFKNSKEKGESANPGLPEVEDAKERLAGLKNN